MKKIKKHILEERYRKVWEITLVQKSLSEKDVEKSRFFFERDDEGKISLVNEKAIPRKFDTFAIACCLPFPKTFQDTLEKYWRKFMDILNQPLAYGLKADNRFVEIFLFQRPGEEFPLNQVQTSISDSLELMKDVTSFKIKFRYPFITPDGTIVSPGFDEPEGYVEQLRKKLREGLKVYPQKQSQWLHTSLGRVLEPIDTKTFKMLLDEMETNWGKEIGEVKVDVFRWMHEKQWYMLNKKELHRKKLPERK